MYYKMEVFLSLEDEKQGANMLTYRICDKCNSKIVRSVLDNNYSICPKCGNYMRFHSRKRIETLADDNTFKEWNYQEQISNPLKDEYYEEILENTKKAHNLNDAVICGEMEIDGIKVVIGVMDTRFMMASMGYIVGERVTRLFEIATKKNLPVILFCCSGGARMQEGIISLMQMEKTAAAVKRHNDSGGLYISVLTNPTMGGVTASFAMLADIILAEKKAMIGFAGARVIVQNTGEKLPEGFQTAEFQKEHGFVDLVVSREKIREDLSFLLQIHKKGRKISKTFAVVKKEKACNNRAGQVNAWEIVRRARSYERPESLDYINRLFPDYYELFGDRVSGDDHAIVAGLATFHGFPVTVIGHQKGKKSFDDAIYRNFGMPSPRGYRKILRLVKQAEKFRRPVIFFVDTIGAACGREAEESGQGLAIAELLQYMSVATICVLSIIIGEGGSGGALALGIGNEVWMLENAIYSVSTPESYASILWKDNSKASKAAIKMKLTAKDLYDLGIIDKIIYESEPITRANMKNVCDVLEKEIALFLKKYLKKKPKKIANDRYYRYRKY